MNQTEATQKRGREIIPPELAVRAMRDSGYRNTAYALAELIDNSVQAKANCVDVICLEKHTLVNQRQRRRMNGIAVLDNGGGMTSDILELALQFGNGTHLKDRSGIGRFGMGLPNSSISQCRRVEVWTWQHGPDNAFYTYLDVDEIETRLLYTLPLPVLRPLPKEWRKRSNIIDTTGTLVLWTKFDEHRLSWRGAKSTLQHTETLIGRMYRKFINDGRLQIRLLSLVNEESTFKRYVRVNDPLYLMQNSSTPEPFDKEPMFQRWGDEDEVFTIQYDGAKHEVVVRMSWARQETVPEDRGSERGAKSYGKHAAKNLGVSIVRVGRELDLDTSWTNSYDPTERWWGAEIEFPPALDEMFGVTNNKQSATIFSDMSQFDWRAEADSGESMSEFLERIKGEGDPRAMLVPIVEHIRKQITEVRKRLKKQTVGTRPKNDRHIEENTMAGRATKKFVERAKQGYETEHDRAKFNKEDRDNLEKDLSEDKDYPHDVAKKIADAVFKNKRRVEFFTKGMDGYAFFNVEYKQGGLTAIVFNTNHPFYSQLIESLNPKIGEETDSELIGRVHKAADALELLFAAWARYEMEEVGQQNRLFEMRQEWGKMAGFFLTENNE